MEQTLCPAKNWRKTCTLPDYDARTAHNRIEVSTIADTL
jgi:hypothetical protein